MRFIMFTLCLMSILLITYITTGNRANVEPKANSGLMYEEFKVYEPPPNAFPKAHLGQSELVMASAFWRIDGELIDFSPRDGKVKRNALSRNEYYLPICIKTDVEPYLTEIRYYRDLDSQGIPKSNVPDESFECNTPNKFCSYVFRDGEVILHLNRDYLKSGVLVLELSFATVESVDIEDGINHYVASWVFDVAT